MKTKIKKTKNMILSDNMFIRFRAANRRLSQLPVLPHKRRDGAHFYPALARQVILGSALTMGGIVAFTEYIQPDLEDAKKPELMSGIRVFNLYF